MCRKCNVLSMLLYILDRRSISYFFDFRNVMSLMRKWQLMVPIVETKQQRKERIREESCKVSFFWMFVQGPTKVFF